MTPQLVLPPETIWRVARLEKGLEFSRIDPVDAVSSGEGNRFDVVGGGVLYAATDVEGCYRETLARLRPAPGMRELDEDGQGFMAAGQVAASWRETRRRFALALVRPLPFIDVEAQATWNALEGETGVLPETVDRLDVGLVRGPDRVLTRAIASWAYTQTDGDGLPLYSGIRYLSRAGNFECWAIFDGTVVVEPEPAGEIVTSDVDLRSVCKAYGLTIH